MTNQEILTKAIEKAIAGGWDCDPHGQYFRIKDKKVVPAADYDDTDEYLVRDVIFNHDFAKALWGDKKHERLTAMMPWKKGTVGSPFFIELALYQYHLQQLVIADDPIKYLGEHLDD